MKRRTFITLLGGAAAAWPIAARAQQAAKTLTIGYLGLNHSCGREPTGRRLSCSDCANWGGARAATLAIEYRWAEGRSERFSEIAAEFVRLKVDAIVTYATPPVIAAKQATSVIPIVFAVAGDPVNTGLVASLAHPGGNVTGLSVQQTELAGKRFELLRELVPGLRNLAIMGNAENPATVLEMDGAQSAARKLGGRSLHPKSGVRRTSHSAFDALKGRAEALYVCNDPLVNTNQIRIDTSALGARLPTVYNWRENVEIGGLMSYGPNFPDMPARRRKYEKYCAGRSQPTFRSNSRPNSTSPST